MASAVANPAMVRLRRWLASDRSNERLMSEIRMLNRSLEYWVEPGVGLVHLRVVQQPGVDLLGVGRGGELVRGGLRDRLLHLGERLAEQVEQAGLVLRVVRVEPIGVGLEGVLVSPSRPGGSP